MERDGVREEKYWGTRILGLPVCLAAAVVILLTPTAESAESWQADWAKTVEGAKKEGRVHIYVFAGASALVIEAGVFQKRFPEIKVVTVSGDPVSRILLERRADKYLADVAIGGATTPYDLYLARALDSIKDAMILPEVRDESKWWGGRHRFTDPERKYALTFIGVPDPGSIYYNTRLVNPKEFQSFRDFLNPKWKGKIHSRDIRSPGTGGVPMKVFYYHPQLGPEFIRRLYSEMDITLFRDRRQGVDWLVTGKFSICFFCTRSDVGRAKAQGLPIEAFGPMNEGMGIVSSSGNMGLLNRAPHPNAARVFVNWFLSREGQMTLQQEYVKHMVSASNSLRIDISKEMIPPDERLQDGVNYIEVETPERISLEPILKVFNEALRAAGKQ